MTLGRLEKHYRVCLRASGRKDAAPVTPLHSQVRPAVVQGLLACGVKNAQSPWAAPEHLDRVYRTSGHCAVTDGILKGISVCTGCVEAPERPPRPLAATEPGGPELHGMQNTEYTGALPGSVCIGPDSTIALSLDRGRSHGSTYAPSLPRHSHSHSSSILTYGSGSGSDIHSWG